ncbi:MAG: GH32 C-terminal domain-containing protein [Bacteroidales bacterium]
MEGPSGIKLLSLLSVLTLAACSRSGEDPVLIEPFEGDTYGEWQQEGIAFDSGPGVEIMAFIGKSHATSLNPDHEPATGTLTSPPFIIERKTIHFLVGAREIDYVSGTMKNPDDLAIQLLVNGEVVRSLIPDEFHAMFHRGWDISDLTGEEAQIRIVDNDNREGAFIDVDHIVQNNIPVEGKVTERIMEVTNNKLNIPVQNGAERYYFEVFAEGKQVRAFDVELATGRIDYWVVTDLSPWSGEEITLRTRQYFFIRPGLLDRITFDKGIIDSEDLYNETLRPQFHFSAKRGWINDPNGLVYHDGEYHLFYQANPFGWDHSRNDYNKTWGHAVSIDLVHWKELPAAIHPDHLGSIYSGSAVIDHLNTTGFQTGKEPPLVAIYTSAGTRNRWSLGKEFTQSIAFSNDRGRTFTPYAGNPVQNNLGYINRDPKAFWYEPSGHWVIVLYLDHGAFAFFTSKDLKSWEQQSILEIGEMGIEEIAAFEDCPELFELPVDRDPENTRWVLYAGSGNYVLGEFDGNKFIPESELIRYNHGDCFYASQTFNNVPEEDGRRIQMAWGTVDLPGMPFNQVMTFPVELTLRNTEDGTRMHGYPVREIESLYAAEHTWDQLTLEPGRDFLPGINNNLLDMCIEFIPGEASEIGFVVNGREISYHTADQLLSSEEEEASLKPLDGKIRLRILVDRVTAEVFGNDGRIYMPLQTDPDRAGQNVEIYTREGSTKIQKMVIHELEPIW